jgi:hypothetical protein
VSSVAVSASVSASVSVSVSVAIGFGVAIGSIIVNATSNRQSDRRQRQATSGIRVNTRGSLKGSVVVSAMGAAGTTEVGWLSSTGHDAVTLAMLPHVWLDEISKSKGGAYAVEMVLSSGP